MKDTKYFENFIKCTNPNLSEKDLHNIAELMRIGYLLGIKDQKIDKKINLFIKVIYNVIRFIAYVITVCLLTAIIVTVLKAPVWGGVLFVAVTGLVVFFPDNTTINSSSGGNKDERN